MAKTTIESVSNNIGLGGNKEKTMKLNEAAYPGDWVYQCNPSGVALIEGSSALKAVKGAVGLKYDHIDCDTQYSQHEEVPIIIEGLVAARCDDPGATKYPGSKLNASGATAGKAGWHSIEAVTGLGFETIAEARSIIKNGDTVGIFKILK